jgi:DNA repair exonuclease SbcCD nuclease subunit
VKIALIADIHVHNFTEFATILPDGTNSRMRDILSVFDHLKKHCLENDIKDVLILGDIFHVRSRIDVGVYDAVYHKFKELVDSGIRLVILVGNHDQALKIGEVHALAPFSEFAEVVDKPTWVRFGAKSDSLTAWLCPFVDDTEILNLQIQKGQQNPPTSGKMLLGLHTSIHGSAIGSINYVMKHGLTVEQVAPENWDWVACGHHHKPQFMTDNMFYIGAPIQHNFGDEGDPRGFMVLDTKKSGKEGIEFIDLTNDLPCFRTLEVAETSDISKLQDLYKGDYVRVKVSGGVKLDSVLAAVPEGVSARLERSADVTHEARINLTNANTTEKILQAYVDHRDVKHLDNGDLVRIGKELMEAVQ